VSVVPSWRSILVVAPLAAAKPMRALSRHNSIPNRMFQWRQKDNHGDPVARVNVVVPIGPLELN
jgi:hypothetical protein